MSYAAEARERALLASRGVAGSAITSYLQRALDVMRASATAPVEAPRSSMGGLIGGEAAKLRELEDLGAGVNGSLLALATRNAVAVLETNATMGVIVAAPTAGSAGVIPAVLLSLQEVHGFSDAQLMDALKNAAVVGSIIARNATVAGAEGGCQAEIGSAAAMAASAAVELLGGTPRMCRLCACKYARLGVRSHRRIGGSSLPKAQCQRCGECAFCCSDGSCGYRGPYSVR